MSYLKQILHNLFKLHYLAEPQKQKNNSNNKMSKKIQVFYVLKKAWRMMSLFGLYLGQFKARV